MRSVEYLYHFTCDTCSLWWSIALEDELRDKVYPWFCPWCGERQKDEE